MGEVVNFSWQETDPEACRHLWLAKINRMLLDACGKLGGYGHSDEARALLQYQARQWFDDGRELRDICDSIGLDYEYVRARALRIIAQHSEQEAA